jgi:hypothetical protein
MIFTLPNNYLLTIASLSIIEGNFVDTLVLIDKQLIFLLKIFSAESKADGVFVIPTNHNIFCVDFGLMEVFYDLIVSTTSTNNQ